MMEIERPKIETASLSPDGRYGKFVAEPLERGFGITLGNSLRRVLLSSLPGVAVTSVKIDGVVHEFSTIEGVKEDVTEIVLNLKGIAAKLYTDGPKTVRVEAVGPCEVTADNIKQGDDIEILNPEWHIATLGEGGKLVMELTFDKGRGYVPAERNKQAIIEKNDINTFFTFRGLCGLQNPQNPGIFIIRKPAQWRFLPKPCCAMQAVFRDGERGYPYNMSLFPSANDFKSGPGVEKDAPRKTGVGRFFELVGRDMSGMFLANLLTCLGFLPVICLVYIGFLMNSLPVMVLSAAVGGILAGPVLAGMYDTVLRALRDEAGYWWTTYRKAFRQNFKASILPGMLYCVVVTVQIFLVYFCFNMLYHGTNVGVGMWVATVLNLILFHMLFSYLWPQIVLLDQPLGQTLKNSVNCMIAFLPHALAASLVTVLFWGLVILCMPLGLLLMLVFGFWFQVEITSQIVYGDLDRVFHIEEKIRKLHDAEYEAEMASERSDGEE